MHALHIEGGRPFGAPVGWDPEKEGGDVFVLWVRVDEEEGKTPEFTSAWTPTPEELAAINRGGPVFLRVVGLQPPVMVWAQEPTAEEDTDDLKAQAILARLIQIWGRPGVPVLEDARGLVAQVLAGGVDVVSPGRAP